MRRARATSSPACRPDADDCVTFHAGTALEDGRLVVTGGRVLCVTALGDTVRAAQKLAYEAVDQVRVRRRAVPRATSATAPLKKPA